MTQHVFFAKLLALEVLCVVKKLFLSFISIQKVMSFYVGVT